MNVKLMVEYDGTAYSGWQRQKNAPSIQEMLEIAISSIIGKKTHVIGSGRTDAGVHALGQVANFKANTRIPVDKLPYAINSKLPEDIVVRHAKKVPDDFHARFCAKRKLYTYTIYNAQFPSPLLRNYSYFFSRPLDVKAMDRASNMLIGSHDFSAFMAAGSSVKSTVRRIDKLQVIRNGDVIKMEIEANGFLYNMVRIIAGTLLKVGLDKIKVEDINSILESKDRTRAGKTLPPQGLCLINVFY
ncbi:MAG: tRNA pseudouridine(38-40) synthase TruA [Tepidanaerobacteraceae bacterium]|nr:tRNA pseudouridine(38-40) synthase TruA [Tepidanaerobacteraceae bacterium]